MDIYKDLPTAFRIINENPIILDFTGCRRLGEIHKILKERFGFPEYYGENWSALWDCLDGLFAGEGPRTVKIIGLKTLPKELNEENRMMLQVFNDTHEENANVSVEVVS